MVVDRAAGIAVSFFGRVMLKIICDYTGVVQFRGSDEIGDAYWTLNMLLAIAATFESVHIHF